MITEYIYQLINLLSAKGMCSGYYCYLYLFTPVFFVIGIYLTFSGNYLKKARKDGNFKNISWQQMEYIAGQYYRELGYKVSVQGGAQADGGIDLVAKRKGTKILIQVKHYKGNVGVKIVREMLGVLIDNGKYDEVHLVTSSGYTKEAALFAGRNSMVKLFTGKQLLAGERK